MKNWKIAMPAVLLAIFLMGCGSKLPGEIAVKNRVESVFNGAEYIGLGKSKTKSGYRAQDHIFRYNGIEFNATEYENASLSLIGFDIYSETKYMSDYGKCLSTFLTPKKLSELSNGKLDAEKLYIYMDTNDEDPDNKDYYISCKTASKDNITKAVETFKLIYDTIYDYLPDNSGDREEQTQALPPYVMFAISVPIDDNGNFSKLNSSSFGDSGSMFAFTIHSKEDIIDWEEVENATRYCYFKENEYLAEQGKKSLVPMTESEKNEIETKKRNSYNTVYYSPKTSYSPSWERLTNDIPTNMR
ncbi:MAG: hypothetical protein IIY78_06010 [Clostridia bacterium]|nr:hypothetical protein [Clostridia bacterium]